MAKSRFLKSTPASNVTYNLDYFKRHELPATCRYIFKTSIHIWKTNDIRECSVSHVALHVFWPRPSLNTPLLFGMISHDLCVKTIPIVLIFFVLAKSGQECGNKRMFIGWKVHWCFLSFHLWCITWRRMSANTNMVCNTSMVLQSGSNKTHLQLGESFLCGEGERLLWYFGFADLRLPPPPIHHNSCELLQQVDPDHGTLPAAEVSVMDGTTTCWCKHRAASSLLMLHV